MFVTNSYNGKRQPPFSVKPPVPPSFSEKLSPAGTHNRLHHGPANSSARDDSSSPLITLYAGRHPLIKVDDDR